MPEKNPYILVLYYSRYGATAAMAQQIVQDWHSAARHVLATWQQR